MSATPSPVAMSREAVGLPWSWKRLTTAPRKKTAGTLE